MILLFCRIWARIRYLLYLDKHGPWGSDYLALCYYHRFNPSRAELLMEEWYPIVFIEVDWENDKEL